MLSPVLIVFWLLVIQVARRAIPVSRILLSMCRLCPVGALAPLARCCIRSARARWLGWCTSYSYYITLRANVNTIRREYLYSFAVPARRYCAGWLVRSHCAPQLRHAIPERRRVGELIGGATRSDRIAENWGKLATHATQKRHPRLLLTLETS